MGVRDTDMPPVTHIDGDEQIAIVQKGENRLATLSDLFAKYYEDILDYAARGDSAFVIWKNTYGTPSSTEEDFLNWLRASIEIVNDFSGGTGKAASAEEVKVLKQSLEALQAAAFTAEDLDNNWSGSTTKPASAAEAKWLKDHIGTGGSGTSINVIDGLDSDSGSDALSARQGKILNKKISDLEESGVGQSTYTWEQFRGVTISQPDVYYDTRGAIINLRTAYELWAKIQKMESDIAELNGSSSVGTTISLNPPYFTSQSSDGGNYAFDVVCSNTWKVLSYGSGIVISSPAGNVTGSGRVTFSYTQNTLQTNQVREITVGVVGTNKTATFTLLQAANTSSGGDVDENAPGIATNISSVSATDDGKIRKNSLLEDKIIIEVETKNTESDWSVSPDSSDWISRSRFGSTLTLSVDRNSELDGRTGSVILKLDDEPDAAPISIIVTQDAYSGEGQGDDPYDVDYGDLVIRNVEVPKNNVYPATGANAVLCVISNYEWALLRKPSWVTIDKDSGPAGETYITISVSSSTEDRDGYIVVGNESETASYHVVQDASLSNYIKIVDTDELDHIHITSTGGNKSFKIYASGDWTAAIDSGNREWIRAVGLYAEENGYEWKGPATGASGAVIQWMSIAENTSDSMTIDTGFHTVTIDGAYGGRLGGVTATLDGVSSSEAKSVLIVAQGAPVGDGILYTKFNPAEIDQNGGTVNLEFYSPRPMTWRVRSASKGIAISHDRTSGTSLPAIISSWVPASGETDRSLGVTIDVHEAGLDTNTLSATIVQKYIGSDAPDSGGESDYSESDWSEYDWSDSDQSGSDGEVTQKTLTINPTQADDSVSFFGSQFHSGVLGFDVTCSDQTIQWAARTESTNVSLSANSGTGNGNVSISVGRFPVNRPGATYTHIVEVYSTNYQNIPHVTYAVTQITGFVIPGIDDGERAAISSSKSSMAFSPSHKTESMTITCETAWDSSCPSWVSMTPSSGSAGTTTVTVTAIGKPSGMSYNAIMGKGVNAPVYEQLTSLSWSDE